MFLKWRRRIIELEIKVLQNEKLLFDLLLKHAKYKEDDAVFVLEGLTGKIERAKIIAPPQILDIFNCKTLYYRVMTETRIKSESAECISSGGVMRRPGKNELFQFYTEDQIKDSL